MANNTLTIYKEVAVEQLGKLKNISCYGDAEHPSWKDVIMLEGEKSITKETEIQIHGDALATNIVMPVDGYDNRGKSDAQNALVIYKGLERMMPREATDERIWVYLCHNDLWEYTGKRWPLPSDPAKRKKHIKTHYFASSARSLVRDNAVSRLWWLGFIATRYESYTGGKVTLEESLEILTSVSDVRAALIERAATAASPEIFNGVMSFLDSCFCRDTKKFSFDRNHFRELMKLLNREGGSKMLNILGPNRVCELLKTNLLQDNNSLGAT